MKKRFLNAALALCMVFSLLPATALAVSGSAVWLGADIFAVNANTSTAATVYYGKDSNNNPYAWRVIGYDGAGIASASGNMTLFANGNLMHSKFDSSNTSNAYASSELKTKVEEIAAGLSTKEKLAVAKRTLAVGAYNWHRIAMALPEPRWQMHCFGRYPQRKRAAWILIYG